MDQIRDAAVVPKPEKKAYRVVMTRSVLLTVRVRQRAEIELQAESEEEAQEEALWREDDWPWEDEDEGEDRELVDDIVEPGTEVESVDEC